MSPPLHVVTLRPGLAAAVAVLVDAADGVLSACKVEGGGEVPRVRPGADQGLARLSPRERDVLALVSEGCANGAIADRLCINLKTVETHVNSVFSKLGLRGDDTVNRRVQAVLIWLGSGPTARATPRAVPAPA